MELPPPIQMLQMIMGSWVAQAVGTTARLGIADHIAAGTRTAEEIAKRAEANPDAVFRMMRALASIGVFTMSGNEFGLTPVGETLRSDVPGSVRWFAIAETDRAHWQTWGMFPRAVKEGRKMSSEALGMEVWDYYREHPDDAEAFSRAMTSASDMATGAVLSSYDFSGAATIADIGGAHGALLQGILADNPQATGVLFDLPHVIEGAKAAIAKTNLGSRITTVSGDFFEGVPAGADIYLLKHIIHDWNDEKSIAILASVKKAMKPTSKVLVIDFALPHDATPSIAHFVDLNMLVMLDGRERTAEQFAALFAKAGLRQSRFIPTFAPVGIAEGVAG